MLCLFALHYAVLLVSKCVSGQSLDVVIYCGYAAMSSSSFQLSI